MEPTEAQFNVWLEASRKEPSGPAIAGGIARLAYAAGADAELQACCDWMLNVGGLDESAYRLRDFRRPKPPSLKQQAVDAFRRRYPARQYYDDGTGNAVEIDCKLHEDLAVIARALQSLPDD
jgi:hypothetical protein